MAGEEEATRTPRGQTGKRPTAPKSPVTIDLAAERIERPPAAAPAEAAHPNPDPPPRPAAPPPPRGAQQRPAAARPAVDIPLPPTRRSGFSFGLLFGAFIGGVVAVALGYLLIITEIVPWPGAGNADAVAQEAARLATEIEGLRTAMNTAPAVDLGPVDTRIAALETAVATMTTLRTEMAAAAQRATNYETRLDTLGAQLAVLARDITTIAAAAGDPAAVTRMTEDLAQFDQRIATLERAAPAVQLNTLQRRVDQLATDLAAVATNVGNVTADAAERDRAEAAARSLAMSSLRGAAERGDPFVLELAALAELGVDPAAITTLDPFATTETPTRAALATAFSPVADAVIAATTEANTTAGFWDRLWNNAVGVVTVRPTGPIEGTTPTAILSRMQAAIDAGDFATALAERATLPEPGLAASADWAAAVQRRLALDAAVEALAETLRREQLQPTAAP